MADERVLRRLNVVIGLLILLILFQLPIDSEALAVLTTVVLLVVGLFYGFVQMSKWSP